MLCMYAMYVYMYVSQMTYGDFGIEVEWLCGDLCHCEDKTYVPTMYVCMFLLLNLRKKLCGKLKSLQATGLLVATENE